MNFDPSLDNWALFGLGQGDHKYESFKIAQLHSYTSSKSLERFYYEADGVKDRHN